MGIFQSVKQFTCLVKLSHTIFGMPFAFIGIVLAVRVEHHVLRWSLFFMVMACMLFARNAAMAFNRWADVDIDAQNPRTQDRPLVQGTLSRRKALYFVIINVLLFIGTTFFINRPCFYLSPLALLIILGYSYTKRFTKFCHFILGIGLSLSCVGAFLAVTAYFKGYVILLSCAVLCWVCGFDMIYALQDEAFDRNKALFSIPAIHGKQKTLKWSLWLHALSIVLLSFFGVALHLGLYYWLGWSLFLGLLAIQHLLIRSRERRTLTKMNIVFLTYNGMASCMFALFTIIDVYGHSY